jgi:hypothetical protein
VPLVVAGVDGSGVRVFGVVCAVPVEVTLGAVAGEALGDAGSGGGVLAMPVAPGAPPPQAASDVLRTVTDASVRNCFITFSFQALTAVRWE